MCEYYDKYWALVEAIRKSTGKGTETLVCIDDILYNIDTGQLFCPYAP
jgi:phosphopantetheinyl transferase (holo-ACP synthase)